MVPRTASSVQDPAGEASHVFRQFTPSLPHQPKNEDDICFNPSYDQFYPSSLSPPNPKSYLKLVMPLYSQRLVLYRTTGYFTYTFCRYQKS